MNCPFRVNQKVREAHEFRTNKTYYNIEQYFPECDKSECPYYDYDRIDGEVCMRVAAEIVKCGICGTDYERMDNK